MNLTAIRHFERIESDDTLTPSEHRFESWDGTELFFRAWHPGLPRRKALILFHGGHEHSGRFQDLVERLALTDLSIFAWDARGHGRSSGPRGHARHFEDFIRDADCFLTHISQSYGIAFHDMALLGHSVGSVIASAWLQDYAQTVRGAVLGSPAFNVKLYAPLALPALRLLQRFRPDAYVTSYVRPSFLTHDKAEAEARRHDELISPRIAVRVLTSLFDTAERVIDNAGSITTPMLILSAGSDWVVRRGAHERFFRKLGSTTKALQLYPGFFHEIFHEKDRQIAILQARVFIESLFSEPSAAAKILPADTQTASSPRPPATAIKRFGYRIVRLALQTLGRLSDGIRLGWKVGFDAGRSLDYIYDNKARGWSPIGRLFDRLYLDTVGWRRIRERQDNLRAQLRAVIEALKAKQQAIHILDIAAGPGRLVIETLEELNDPEITAVCRDLTEGELYRGRRAAMMAGVETISFQRRDAFDPDAYTNLNPRPDIVIVSGLYELFRDNHCVEQSLAAIHGAMSEDGRLIYTNQPHHPQLELIANTLINRHQQPWVMRPRSQSEMHELLRRAGFEPEDMLIDADGIFVVGTARKRMIA